MALIAMPEMIADLGTSALAPSRYVNKAFLVVTGICEDGYREIRGARIPDGEDELLWYGLFGDLKQR